MEQLSLTLLYEPTADLRELRANRWSYESPSLADWFARVEALPEFKVVMGRQPVGCEVLQEDV